TDPDRDPSDPVSPAAGLHDCGASVSVRVPIGDKDRIPEKGVAVPPDDEIDPGYARGEGAVLADPDVGHGDHEIRLRPDLRDESRRDRDRIGYRNAGVARAAHDRHDLSRREPQHRDPDA